MSFTRTAQTSEWASYQPTFNTINNDGSLGNGTLQGKWRRNGNSADVIIRFVWGSTTSGGTGEFRFSIPTNMRIDPSQLPENSFPARVTSSVYLSDAGTATNRRAGTIEAVTNSLVRIIPNGASTTTATSPFTWVSTDNVQMSILIPIIEFT